MRQCLVAGHISHIERKLPGNPRHLLKNALPQTPINDDNLRKMDAFSAMAVQHCNLGPSLLGVDRPGSSRDMAKTLGEYF